MEKVYRYLCQNTPTIIHVKVYLGEEKFISQCIKLKTKDLNKVFFNE